MAHYTLKDNVEMYLLIELVVDYSCWFSYAVI